LNRNAGEQVSRSQSIHHDAVAIAREVIDVEVHFGATRRIRKNCEAPVQWIGMASSAS
jgi:hypothetical protein